MILVFGTRPPSDDPESTQRYAAGVCDVLDRVLDATLPTVLLEGGAKGPDLWARHLVSRADRVGAGWSNQSENVTEEQWRSLGRAAGPLRNKRMAEILKGQSGHLNRLAVGFWNGESAGTRSMITELYRVSIAPLIFHVDERFQVSWPTEWRSVIIAHDDGNFRIVVAGTNVNDARVVLSPLQDLIGMRWPILHRNRDAAGWSGVEVEPWTGWPVAKLPAGGSP